MGQVHLFEKIMIVFGSRGQFYHHRYTYLILHNGVYLHAAFLLSAFRMSIYSLKNVIKMLSKSVIVIESIIYSCFSQAF